MPARFCPICDRETDEGVCVEDGTPTLALELLGPAGPEAVVGTVLAGRYRIDAPLGSGGMGHVYTATQLNMSRRVAVKTLKPAVTSDRRLLRRFFAEARALSRLSSPHVVRVFDFGVDEATRTPWIAMELLHGRTLKRCLRDDGPFPLWTGLRLIHQVGRALADAHGVGIVHRDLKPSNIIMLETADGGDFAKLTDFGIAKDTEAAERGVGVTTTGVAIGTPTHMSPEQVLGQRVDARADLYALGILLYQVLTGRPPFTSQDRMALLNQHLSSPPPQLPGAPAALRALYLELLAKQPARRPESIHHVLARLEAIQQDAGELAGPPLGQTDPTLPDLSLDTSTAPGTETFSRLDLDAPDLAPPSRTHRTGRWVLGVAALAALGLGGWLLSQPPAPAPAQSIEAQALSAPAVPEAPEAQPEPESEAEPEPEAESESESEARAESESESESEPESESEAGPPRETAPEPGPVAFEIVSRPEGAEVFEGDKPLGKTPLRLEVAPGELPKTLEVRSKRREPQRVELREGSGGRLEVTLKRRWEPRPEPAPRPGSGRPVEIF